MGIPDLSTPEYLICWPSDLLVDEIATTFFVNRNSEQFKAVLDEAFVGSGLSDLWNLTEVGLGSGEKPPFTKDNLALAIVTTAKNGDLRHEAERTPYFRERKANSQPGQAPFTVDLLRRRFVEVVSDLDGEGYFDLKGAEPCIDDEHWDGFTLPDLVHRDLGLAINFGFSARRSGPRQGDRSIEDLEEDEFYDLVEYLHDHAARPRSSSFHAFGGCGYHFSNFAIGVGQRLYRWRVNQLFDSSVVDLRLEEEGDLTGRLIGTTDTGRAMLIERVLAEDGLDRDQVAHALNLFRQRGATEHDKRSAVVALARVLEAHRKMLKAELLSKDEGALFDIANNFDLRHDKSNQKSDYDPMFLDWIFWWYLATIELLQQLVVRQNNDPIQKAESHVVDKP